MIKCPRHGCDNTICGCGGLISDEEFKAAGLGVKRKPVISFFVPGEPAAQGRPRTRVARRGYRAYAQIYNPHNADEWKARVSIIARPLAPKPAMIGPVRLSATFFILRPASHYRGKAHTLRPEAPVWHFIKPDGDNYAKALIDALTGIGMWVDDAQVCDQRIMKFYTENNPGCQVAIEAIETTPLCPSSHSEILTEPPS